MFEKSSAGNGSSSRDANYHQYGQALRYRSDRCSLGADRADVTGSPTRWPTTHNRHSCCVKRNLLSTTNRLPMAFASPRVSSVEHGLSLLPSLEERWCLDLRPALNVPASSTASREDRLSVGRHHGWPVGQDDGTWRHSRLRRAQACQRPQAPHSGGHLRAAHRMQGISRLTSLIGRRLPCCSVAWVHYSEHSHSHSGCRTPKSQARSTPAAARWLEATDRQTSAACV